MIDLDQVLDLGNSTTGRAHRTALCRDERFERFWACYPNKKKKQIALKAWQKLHPSEALADVIMAAVARQRTWPTWTKDGGAYIPHPSSWLNAGSWDDEAAVASVSHVSEIGRQNAANAEIALQLMELADAGK